MQAFGDFFCRIEKNSIYFVRMDSGYACIRRYLFAQNRKPLGSAKKIPALAHISRKMRKYFRWDPIIFIIGRTEVPPSPILNSHLSTLNSQNFRLSKIIVRAKRDKNCQFSTINYQLSTLNYQKICIYQFFFVPLHRISIIIIPSPIYAHRLNS